MVDIQHGSNRFYVEKDGQEIGEVTYVPQDGNIVVDHTFVSPSMRGQGIAEQLVDKVVEYARNEGYKIIPTCSYVVKRMRHVEQYKDVLAST
ncbi:GNAT family N-acetyltransferase [Longirhabdus pacifica]|uniref:GNAT family N-acetyltransferase n=1 Tax=Longirhabdus pacifica TaxID=2305227 RepID=UPI001008AFF3|nr:GNAT family N-acetyltransferase [Longirhabdus pacifica]